MLTVRGEYAVIARQVHPRLRHQRREGLLRALKPAGLVVFVEYSGEDPAVPIKTLHKMTEAQVKREMRALPLDWVRTSEVLPIQHIIVFRRR
jgi:ribosomal protein L25 (general stress protein Ctc)